MKNYPKILIGCPTFDGKNYIRESYFTRLKELTYPRDKITFLFVDNSINSDNTNWINKKGFTCLHVYPAETIKETLARCRNVIRDYFLEGNYDFYFSLEADIIPPVDIIERLLKYKKQLTKGVVGAWYDIGSIVHKHPCIMGIKDKPASQVTELEK